jgi:hypothetical protein
MMGSYSRKRMDVIAGWTLNIVLAACFVIALFGAVLAIAMVVV